MKIIAHRGASAHRPEHTRSAYELAIARGADFIEPDLVVSRDGVLVVRHEIEIGGTTDVADHPAFVDRRRTLTIDRLTITDWFACDFTWAELQTLRARERLPDLRPANTVFRDEPILRFEQVLEIARSAGVGVCPELKHPSFHKAQGLDIELLFTDALSAMGDAPALIVQCFEIGTLQWLAACLPAPFLMQLIAAHERPADRADLDARALISPEGLADIALYADWIGVEAMLVEHPGSTLVADAHAAGLQVAVWTMRPENTFLPLAFQNGPDPAAHGDLRARIAALKSQGVNAVFTDAP